MLTARLIFAFSEAGLLFLLKLIDYQLLRMINFIEFQKTLLPISNRAVKPSGNRCRRFVAARYLASQVATATRRGEFMIVEPAP